MHPSALPHIRSTRRAIAHGLAAAAVLCAAASSAWSADLQVTVSGLRSDTGEVMLALYDNEATFLKQSFQASKTAARARGDSDRVTLVFKDVPPGRYALSGFHDLNGNGAVVSNLMRIPTEPLGFSNGAQPRFGPPTFTDAAFTVGGDPLQLDVVLR